MIGYSSRFILLFGMVISIPFSALAKDWQFSQSGLAGIYYGIMEDRDKNNIDNLPNRMVFRADGKLDWMHKPDSSNKVGIHADYTIIYRQHYPDYSEGDWRFYPYILTENKQYGRATIGYSHSAAYQMHQGAGKISWIGVQDSNLTYFLSSTNWSNGRKKVKFATPKSTNILGDGRALKFAYFTPEIANTQFGLSYTPDNANRRGMNSRYAKYHSTDDGYTAGMKNKWRLPIGTAYTSVTHGMFNRTDKEWAFGARWDIDAFYVSASYKKAYIDGGRNPIATTKINNHLPAYFDNYREGQAWDFSIGYDFGRFKTHLAYLHTESTNTRNSDDLFIQENRLALNKYFELFLINGYINSKGLDRNSDENNKGYTVVTGLAIKY